MLPADPVAVAAGQPVIDVDPVRGDTQPGEPFALDGEVLFVGGASGVSDEKRRHGAPPVLGRPGATCSGHRQRRQPLQSSHLRKASNSARRGSDLNNFAQIGLTVRDRSAAQMCGARSRCPAVWPSVRLMELEQLIRLPRRLLAFRMVVDWPCCSWPSSGTWVVTSWFRYQGGGARNGSAGAYLPCLGT